MVKSNFCHGKIYIFIRAGRIQGARGESKVREENPGCARRIQGARGESRVREENPGYTGRIQGASHTKKIYHFTMVNIPFQKLQKELQTIFGNLVRQETYKLLDNYCVLNNLIVQEYYKYFFINRIL
jgi:hypothetical protein